MLSGWMRPEKAARKSVASVPTVAMNSKSAERRRVHHLEEADVHHGEVDEEPDEAALAGADQDGRQVRAERAEHRDGDAAEKDGKHEGGCRDDRQQAEAHGIGQVMIVERGREHDAVQYADAARAQGMAQHVEPFAADAARPDDQGQADHGAHGQPERRRDEVPVDGILDEESRADEEGQPAQPGEELDAGEELPVHVGLELLPAVHQARTGRIPAPARQQRKIDAAAAA